MQKDKGENFENMRTYFGSACRYFERSWHSEKRLRGKMWEYAEIYWNTALCKEINGQIAWIWRPVFWQGLCRDPLVMRFVCKSRRAQVENTRRSCNIFRFLEESADLFLNSKIWGKKCESVDLFLKLLNLRKSVNLRIFFSRGSAEILWKCGSYANPAGLTQKI